MRIEKLLGAILLAIAIVSGGAVSVQAGIRLQPEGRELSAERFGQYRVAYVSAQQGGAVANDPDPVYWRDSLPINLGPVGWSWSDGGETNEVWRVTRWLDSHDQYVGAYTHWTANDPTQYTTVRYDVVPSLPATGSRFRSHNDTFSRNYLVITAGFGGSLLANYYENSTDCRADNRCNAYDEGTVFSIPTTWEVTVTVP